MAGQAGEIGTELSELLKNGAGTGSNGPGGSHQPAEPVVETSLFRDEELIEEAKYHSPAPAPPAEDGELPDSYGQARVTLMVVNPYLVFAYWDVDLTRLPPETVGAALHFHDLAEPPSSRFFELDVDLRTRNWYVQLWSPAKSYYADLGVKTADGGFTSLARSNQLQTPRAWPMAEVEPPASPAASPTPPFTEPVSPGAAGPATVEVPWRHSETAAPRAPSGSEGPPAVLPTMAAAQPEPHHPAAADEVLQRRLAEIYALQEWYPRALAAGAAQYEPFGSGHEAPLPEAAGRSAPQNSASQPSSQPGTPLDLTALAEHEFSPGFSSALLSPSTPRRPPG